MHAFMYGWAGEVYLYCRAVVVVMFVAFPGRALLEPCVLFIAPQHQDRKPYCAVAHSRG